MLLCASCYRNMFRALRCVLYLRVVVFFLNVGKFCID